MTDQKSPERRHHVRYPLATTVQVYHGPSQRRFPAQTVDLSAGGALMYVPVAVPVAPGQPIRLTIGSHSRPELAGLSNRPLSGTIVRVDRYRILDGGHMPVGVRFSIGEA